MPISSTNSATPFADNEHVLRRLRTRPECIEIGEHLPESLSFRFETVPPGGFGRVGNQLRHFSRRQGQSNLCGLDQILESVVRSKGIDARKAEGPIADTVRADYEGSESHAFERREEKPFLLIR